MEVKKGLLSCGCDIIKADCFLSIGLKIGHTLKPTIEPLFFSVFLHLLNTIIKSNICKIYINIMNLEYLLLLKALV